MKIGIVACNVIKREIDKLLPDFPEVTQIIYLDGALHIDSANLKEAVKSSVTAMKECVDVVFLGYGYCQSLKGIEEELDVPVVLPQLDDCISLLLTPERYAEEIRKEVGTWFITPGWAAINAEMIIKGLQLDRVVKYGKDPMDMAKRLFTHYRRGLLIDTGVEDDLDFTALSEAFCHDFNLIMDKTTSNLSLLREWLERCRTVDKLTGPTDADSNR